MILVSLALGAGTHVLWDAFTHRGRFGEAVLPVLGSVLGPFALTGWLQYASGIGGMAVLAAAATVALRRGRVAPVRPVGGWRWIARASLATVTIAGGCLTIAGGGFTAPTAVVFDAAVGSVRAVATGAFVLGVVVLAAGRPGGRGSRTAAPGAG